MENNITQEILTYFKEMQTVFVATCDNERPYVRPMLLLFVDDTFWLATGANDAKTPQLRLNPHFEFCFLVEKGVENGSIRGSGKVEFVQDMEIRKRFIDNFSYIRHYWQEPDDPTYILLQLHVDSFEFMRPGEQTSEKVQL
jgi:uncharacterized pyridoxamine 5'-phosphate oxidase family protein